MKILDHIRTVPDFPKPGINFYDIASLLAHPPAWEEAIRQLEERARAYDPDMVLGIESRGFLLAAPLGLSLKCRVGMIRKKGKLPGKTISHAYTLEYGQDEIELQPDMLPDGGRILLVDDLLATGGTLQAAEALIGQTSAQVAASLCIIELEGLGGRDKLTAPFEALLSCPA